MMRHLQRTLVASAAIALAAGSAAAQLVRVRVTDSTGQALPDVDVALVFSTDPTLEQRGLRLLEDDRGLEPAENVTPVVAGSLVERYGDRLTGPVDAVSGRLTTDVLVGLNRAVARGRPAKAVAASWLEAEGLI